jgi:hypothetical protein
MKMPTVCRTMLVTFMPICALKRSQDAVGDGQLIRLAIEVPSPKSAPICCRGPQKAGIKRALD